MGAVGAAALQSAINSSVGAWQSRKTLRYSWTKAIERIEASSQEFTFKYDKL